ncbi:hypothetical protein OIO90_004027 [Microbotryomycetes sp. JL221]|nr:hypothetical protein OIO90_004027 [Microbotryomycetes sp. JL221]
MTADQQQHQPSAADGGEAERTSGRASEPRSPARVSHATTATVSSTTTNGLASSSNGGSSVKQEQQDARSATNVHYAYNHEHDGSRSPRQSAYDDRHARHDNRAQYQYPPVNNYYRGALPQMPPPAGAPVHPQHPSYSPYGHAASPNAPQLPPPPPVMSQWPPPPVHYGTAGYGSYPPPGLPGAGPHHHHGSHSPYQPHYHPSMAPPPPPVSSTTSVAHSQGPMTSLAPVHASAPNYMYPNGFAPPPPPPGAGMYDWSSAQLPPIRLHPPAGSAPLSMPPPTHHHMYPYPPPAPSIASSTGHSSASIGRHDARHPGSGESSTGSYPPPPQPSSDQNPWSYDASLSMTGNNNGRPRDSYGPVPHGHDDHAQFQNGVHALNSLSRAGPNQSAGEPDGAAAAPGPSNPSATQDSQREGSPTGPRYVKPISSDSEDDAPREPGAKRKRKRRRRANEEPRDLAYRKFTCEVCKKMFARPSALATHERSHSKEKPHVCPFPSCGRPFAVPSNLRRHQRVYNHYDPNQPVPADSISSSEAATSAIPATATVAAPLSSSETSGSSTVSTSTKAVQTMPLMTDQYPPPGHMPQSQPQYHLGHQQYTPSSR